MKAVQLSLVFILTIVWQTVAFAATPIANPAALTYIRYTEASPNTDQYYGRTVAMSENYMLTGVRFRDANEGGYDIYRKAATTGWELESSVTFDRGSYLFGRSVAMDSSTMLVSSTLFPTDGKAGAGLVVVIMRNNSGHWTNVAELAASDPQTSSYFGSGLAVDGNTIAAGAYGLNSSAGAAYIFNYENGLWSQTAKITAPDANIADSFGEVIALRGNILAIAAPDANFKAGAVYIYENVEGTWTYRKTLSHTGGMTEEFGKALAISDKWLLVGSKATVGGFANAGDVRVYDISDSDIPLVTTLTAPTSAANNYFGHAVALDGNLAAIGSMNYAYTNNNYSGSTMVYQYDGSQWNYIRQLPMHEIENGMEFGYAVAVKRSHIAVGAKDMTVNGKSNAGALFTYDLNQTWMSAGAHVDAELGYAVALNQSHAAASAHQENVGAVNDAGKVYVYRRQGAQWITEAEITQPEADRATDNEFGTSIDLGRNALIASSPYSDISSSSDGAVYIYERSGTNWVQKKRIIGPAAETHLGYSVAIDEPFAAVTRTDDGADKTYVQIYERDDNGTWNEQPDEILTTYTGNTGFISDIDILGNYMVIGASAYDSFAGATFFYEWTGSAWTNIGIRKSSTAGRRYGQSVAIWSNMAVVGSSGYDSDNGRAYVYDIKRNVMVEVLEPPVDSPDRERFGYSVAFAENGNVIAVSAYRKHEGSLSDAGSVHIFRRRAGTDKWDYESTTMAPDSGLLNSYSYFGKALAGFGSTIAAGLYGYEGNIGSDIGAVALYEVSPRVAPADFDGDGITDIGCYYAPGGNWYVYKSAEQALWLNTFGYAGTVPFVDDFDGDWITDFGCYDPASGYWFFYGSSRGFWVESFGAADTTRFTGDFDGDGISDYGYYDPASSSFRMMRSAAGYKEDAFGPANSYPVTGDFDGDGLDDYGTYNPPNGQWNIRRSREGDWSTQFGFEGTTPITGDFDGDSIEDFGCYYPETGGWYIYKSTDGFWVNNFGYAGTTPVTGDFDGDGIADFGCYFPPIGAWYVYKSTDGFWVNNFGYEGTVPMN